MNRWGTVFDISSRNYCVKGHWLGGYWKQRDFWKKVWHSFWTYLFIMPKGKGFEKSVSRHSSICVPNFFLFTFISSNTNTIPKLINLDESVSSTSIPAKTYWISTHISLLTKPISRTWDTLLSQHPESRNPITSSFVLSIDDIFGIPWLWHIAHCYP